MTNYGPLGVLGAIAGFLAFFYWKNEARKNRGIEFDDHKPSSPEAFERFRETLPEVRD